ncbi:hypothetical protein K525DRAFT_210832 [Schizophyllum commune Loenen D]|nr:hypothetical protein K525DRAFT_210832 [Schizophyllum commune Loenen D]
MATRRVFEITTPMGIKVYFVTEVSGTLKIQPRSRVAGDEALEPISMNVDVHGNGTRNCTHEAQATVEAVPPVVDEEDEVELPESQTPEAPQDEVPYRTFRGVFCDPPAPIARNSVHQAEGTSSTRPTRPTRPTTRHEQNDENAPPTRPTPEDQPPSEKPDDAPSTCSEDEVELSLRTFDGLDDDEEEENEFVGYQDERAKDFCEGISPGYAKFLNNRFFPSPVRNGEEAAGPSHLPEGGVRKLKGLPIHPSPLAGHWTTNEAADTGMSMDMDENPFIDGPPREDDNVMDDGIAGGLSTIYEEDEGQTTHDKASSAEEPMGSPAEEVTPAEDAPPQDANDSAYVPRAAITSSDFEYGVSMFYDFERSTNSFDLPRELPGEDVFVFGNRQEYCALIEQNNRRLEAREAEEARQREVARQAREAEARAAEARQQAREAEARRQTLEAEARRKEAKRKEAVAQANIAWASANEPKAKATVNAPATKAPVGAPATKAPADAKANRAVGAMESTMFPILDGPLDFAGAIESSTPPPSPGEATQPARAHGPAQSVRANGPAQPARANGPRGPPRVPFGLKFDARSETGH